MDVGEINPLLLVVDGLEVLMVDGRGVLQQRYQQDDTMEGATHTLFLGHLPLYDLLRIDSRSLPIPA